jgi:hypothetical protein
MSARGKLISGIVLAAAGLATWMFMSPASEIREPATATPAPVRVAETAALPDPVKPLQENPQNSLDAPQPVERNAEPNALTEQNLVGTKWEREGFGLEFAANGKLLIAGRERAQWRVEGRRVRLYRDTTGEEHWLDIAGHKLLWNGQEIGRVP